MNRRIPRHRARLAALIGAAALVAGAAPAQNLVVNPGFESYSACPPALGQLDGHCDDWGRTGLGSTDYHNTCGFSTHAPRTGEGHLGLIPFDSSADYREYATGRLGAPLEAGVTYRVEFWVILSEGRLHAIRELAAWFTDAPPSFSGAGPPPGVTPQVVHSGPVLEDKENWMRVSESFVAAGGESFITLGNFFADADTTSVFFGCCGQHGAYYHLDDVSVVEESSTPVLEASCAVLGDRCPEDPALDANGQLDYSEALEVEVSVSNVGSVDVTGYEALVEAAGATVESPAGGALSAAAIAVGETVVFPVTLRLPGPDEGLACFDPIDVALRGQVADGGIVFPDDELEGCDAVLDGCKECRPTCLHRFDVTRLSPHEPARDDVYQARTARDVALQGPALACPFASGDLEPDPAALGNGVALSLYQVDRPVGSLRLAPAGETIRFDW